MPTWAGHIVLRVKYILYYTLQVASRASYTAYGYPPGPTGGSWREGPASQTLGRVERNVALFAVIASEDQRFLQHHGFDFSAIQQAVEEHERTGRRRGASTISQQTAKNVFLWPESSWLRKGLEVYFTALIELCWSKERIMEVYLNVIEMGDGVYGAEAVAQLHFGCSAGELTRNQCALIAASLPNPLKLDSARPSRYLMRRQKAVMTQMKHVPLFTAKKD